MPKPVPIKWWSENGRECAWSIGLDAAPPSEHNPLVYTYGICIDAAQRAAVEIALHRWQRELGFQLARPMTYGDLSANVYIDTAPLEKVEFDPTEFKSGAVGAWGQSGHVEVAAAFPDKEPDSGLEHVLWLCHEDAPTEIVAARFLLERGRRREGLVEPGMHGWGHIWGLDHPDEDEVQRHLALMNRIHGGHFRPTDAEIEAVAKRYGG